MRPMIRAVRDASRRFKSAEAAHDIVKMEAASEKAWNSLTIIFETLRNEEDQGRLDSIHMAKPTGYIVNGINIEDQQAMIVERKLDRSHSTLGVMSLRDALNKIAHHDTSQITYRIDRRGAHYLILGGAFRGKIWLAEILVSKLVKHAAAAAEAIR
ncbi:hypothetical protein ACF3NX_12950 (plasmid) [Acetobacter orientalis]|uniref:hypothetical protein n=1 Tax=Acetobacter orientalis TaxID=146474 RepID=UPI00386CB9C9